MHIFSLIILRPPVTVEQDDKEITLTRNQCGSLIQHLFLPVCFNMSIPNSSVQVVQMLDVC
jgi:hypothetical protein